MRISGFAVEERGGRRVHSLGSTCWRLRRLLPRAEELAEELPAGMCAVS